MKYLGLLFIFTSLNSYSAPSAEVYMDSLKQSNPQLAKALEIEGVDSIYQSCMSKPSAVESDDGVVTSDGIVRGEKLMKCVWDGVQLDPDLKEQVLATMKENMTAKNKEDVASSRYQEKASLDATRKNKSASLLALEKYLQKQLEDALYGERVANDKNLYQRERAVSQKVFFDLFDSQLGKNVINILSSYCIESEMLGSDYFLIPEQKENRDIVRNNNLSTIADVSSGQLQSAAKWNKCVGNIQHHCHQTGTVKELKDGVLVDYVDDNGKTHDFSNSSIVDKCKKINSKDEKFYGVSCADAVVYTKQRACEVTDYISRARKSLDANEKIVKGMEKLDLGRDPTSVTSYTDKDAKKKIDELTSLTSNQMIESGALAAAKEESTQFETCLKDDEIQDEEACKQFLQTNRDEHLAELAEYKLNSEASIGEIQKLEIGEDDERIKKLLIEDGYSKDDAEKLASNADILKEIKERYKAKEKALQDSVLEQINKITSKKEGEVADIDKDTLKEIGKELKSKTQDFAKLVHYNNIVSSYLTITSEDEENGTKTRQNTAMLQRELASNAFSDENAKIAKEVNSEFNGSGIDYEKLDQAIQDTGVSLDPGSDVEDSPTVKSEDIVKSILGLFRTKE